MVKFHLAFAAFYQEVKVVHVSTKQVAYAAAVGIPAIAMGLSYLFALGWNALGVEDD